jgi:3-hydroxybutyrate dehydrogenase
LVEQTLCVPGREFSNLFVPLLPLFHTYLIYAPPQPWSNFWNPPGTLPSKDNSAESRYAIIDINITHPIRVTQMAISHFLSRKKAGCIPHVTSVAGQCPFFPTPVYVASKHAINGFVRSLAPLESPPSPLPKIRVNAVAPARILTPLWTDNPEKMRLVGKEPGWVTPETVAEVMLGLIEKEEWVGGTIMEVGKTVREVTALDDPGPSAGGNDTKAEVGYQNETWESLRSQFDVV